MAFHRPHHRQIERILESLNKTYFQDKGLMFGGGTRIALDIDEFRVSTDIDIVCPTSESYRAVRENVNSVSLGKLLTRDLSLPRGVQIGRDAVRTVVEIDNSFIQLEFIRFEGFEFKCELEQDLFPVPYINRESCYYSKLLANANRYTHPSKKDILDILAMTTSWGDIPAGAIKGAEAMYGERAILPNLRNALHQIIADKEAFNIAASDCGIEKGWREKLFLQAQRLQKKLTPEQRPITLLSPGMGG